MGIFYRYMKKQGKFLGIPYDFRKPTWKRIKERAWNKDDSRIFTPKVFGWGYTFNFYHLFHTYRNTTIIIIFFIVTLLLILMTLN